MSTKYNLIYIWGSEGTGNGQFKNPVAITVDANGYVYVTDYLNNRFLKFTSIGQYVDTWGSYGHGHNHLAEFDRPKGIAADKSGNLFIADSNNNRIQQWKTDGVWVNCWGRSGPPGAGVFSIPNAVAVDAIGNIFTADSNGIIQAFGFLGHISLYSWGGKGIGEDGKFKECIGAQGIAVDAAGYVYVSDTGWNRIQKFSSTGQFVKKWGSCGSGHGEFNSPHGLAVDVEGHVYVADTGNHRIQKFTSDGDFVTLWGGEGTDNGQFQHPLGVAINNFGNVYVVDTDNFRIQMFAPALQPDFSVDNREALVNRPAKFTDRTTNGVPQKWKWNFGDRKTSELKNPNHTYTKPGTYSVTLTVSSTTQGSSTRTKRGYIRVLD